MAFWIGRSGSWGAKVFDLGWCAIGGVVVADVVVVLFFMLMFMTILVEGALRRRWRHGQPCFLNT